MSERIKGKPHFRVKHEIPIHCGQKTIGIYNETDSLLKAAVWGPVGAEAVLAQLYPQATSLFYDSMNVVKARDEAFNFSSVLNNFGVTVFSVRDQLAQLLPEQTLNKSDILKRLALKATDIQRKRNMFDSHIADDIEELVEDDITRYGQDRALVLNQRICLESILPMGNLIYARDQMNVLLGTRFISRMSKPIRQGEVSLYELAYENILGTSQPASLVPEGETFEGGDAYVHDNTVYVGVGIRTTRGAAKHIYETLESELRERSMRMAIVEDPDPTGRTQDQQLDFMHLDTFSGPIGDKQVAVCEEEADRRRVKFLERTSDGVVVAHDTGQTFLEHLLNSQKDVIRVYPVVKTSNRQFLEPIFN